MLIDMNTSANLSASMFFSELMRISTDIVWKNQTLANRYEDPVNYNESETFMAAYRDILTFESIYQFSYDILILAGLSMEQALAGMDSKETIPSAYRNLCVTKYINYILEKNSSTGRYVNYIERNNYYRMLFGLPDIEDTEYLYNTLYDDISKEIPIHELTISERYILENRGYLSTLIEQYPDKKYLKHLTSKCIDPYTSRNAERFSILWMSGSDFSNLIMDFKTLYEDCRMNINRVYYTEAFKKESELYDGFLAMCILFMTIQLMHYKYLDTDLTREFYDLDSIKYIYNSYSVPFYSSIPLSYHTKIVKKLNTLLSYKGSSRVFFDLFELFDYGTIDVYNYFILKLHKFDMDNKPIFIKNEDETYDYSSMFDIKFAKVKMYENIQMQISNPINHIDYDDMVTLDPYWVSDEALLDKLYNTQFNYLESKYIGLQVVYDLTKIMYESSFFFKALLDNKTEIANLSIYLPSISSSIKLFNIIIYICALICKKYGYEGNISNKIPIVSKILGFNFKDDMSTIRADIIANDYLKDDTELLALLLDMDMNNISSINSTLDRIDSLQKLLSKRKIDADNRAEFFAYYNLEKTLMTSDFIEEIYTKSNGDIASSFSDLLADIENVLYTRLNSVDVDINDEINSLLNLLLKSFSTLDYINYSDINTVDAMVSQIFKLLFFFKSAKSELTGYHIVYMFSSRNANMIKFLDNISSHNISLNIDDLLEQFEDNLHIQEILCNYKDKNMTIYDLLRESYRVYLLDENGSYLDKIFSVIFSTFTFNTKSYSALKDDDINISLYDSKLKDDKVFQNDSLTLIHETLIGD